MVTKGYQKGVYDRVTSGTGKLNESSAKHSRRERRRDTRVIDVQQKSRNYNCSFCDY